MSARDEILSKIRAATGTHDNIEARRAHVREHIANHPQGIVPKHSNTGKALQKQFRQKAAAAAATIEFRKPGAVGDAIAEYLRDHNLPPAIRTGEDRRLGKLLKGAEKFLDIGYGPSSGDDLVCVSHALGGVAETGTLFLTSGKDNPTTLNFLPESHIVILRETDIEASYEALLQKLRRNYGAGEMPRTVNMITGPSRSADIEQTLILGAHGPLRLHIIVVEE